MWRRVCPRLASSKSHGSLTARFTYRHKFRTRAHRGYRAGLSGTELAGRQQGRQGHCSGFCVASGSLCCPGSRSSRARATRRSHSRSRPVAVARVEPLPASARHTMRRTDSRGPSIAARATGSSRSRSASPHFSASSSSAIVLFVVIVGLPGKVARRVRRSRARSK